MNDIAPTGQLLLNRLEINPKEIKNIKPRWKRTNYRAVINWLTQYKPRHDASDLEKVRGLLEAFHHLCQTEAWEQAAQILFTRLITPTKDELHDQLNIWGYYQEQEEVYGQVLDKINPKLNAIIFNSLGRLSDEFGDYPQAIEYHQQSLAIDCQLGELQGQGASLGNLGSVYFSMGDFDRAIQYHQQHLNITKEINYLPGQADALGGLGSAHCALGDYSQAIEYHQQQLTITKKINDGSIAVSGRLLNSSEER